MVNRATSQTQRDTSAIRHEAEITDRGERSHDNQRQHSRYSVDLDVTVGSEHNFYAGLVENLSAGGVFVATHSLKGIGEQVELSIRLPETENVIKGAGIVRWIREYNEASDTRPGMGIQFVSLEPGSQKAIEEFLARREPLFFDD